MIGLGQQAIQTKEQINYIYIVRALAIIAVILVHVSSIPVGDVAAKSSTIFFAANFLNIFNKFGTSTFIFLSAFVLFYSYYDRPINRKLMAKFYKRRLLYIVIPYVICSVYYYVIQMYYSYGESWTLFAQYTSFANFLNLLLMGKAFYHLYFVFISMQFYILFPLLLWIFQRKPNITKYLIWIGIALQIGFILYNQFSLQYADKGQLAISYIAYYFMGAYFGIYYNTIKEWIIVTKKTLLSKKALLIASVWLIWIIASLTNVYLWYTARAYGTSHHALSYELIWFVQTMTVPTVLLQMSSFLYRKLHPRITNMLIHLGIVSFGVYIIHAGIIFYYSRLPASSSPMSYVLYVFGGFLVTLALSWAIVGLAMKYMTNSWILFGSAPKKSPYIEIRQSPSIGQKAEQM